MTNKFYVCEEVPVTCEGCSSYDCDRRVEKYAPKPALPSLEDKVLRLVAATSKLWIGKN